MCACECVHVSAANGSSGCQNCHFEWDITKSGGGVSLHSLILASPASRPELINGCKLTALKVSEGTTQLN